MNRRVQTALVGLALNIFVGCENPSDAATSPDDNDGGSDLVGGDHRDGSTRDQTNDGAEILAGDASARDDGGQDGPNAIAMGDASNPRDESTNGQDAGSGGDGALPEMAFYTLPFPEDFVILAAPTCTITGGLTDVQVTADGQLLNTNDTTARRCEAGGQTWSKKSLPYDDGNTILSSLRVRSVAAAPDGSYYAVGLGTAVGGLPAHVAKHSATGNVLWAREVVGSQQVVPFFVRPHPSGGVVLFGTTTGLLADEADSLMGNEWTARFDADGNQVFAHQPPRAATTYSSIRTHGASVVDAQGTSFVTFGSVLRAVGATGNVLWEVSPAKPDYPASHRLFIAALHILDWLELTPATIWTGRGSAIAQVADGNVARLIQLNEATTIVDPARNATRTVGTPLISSAVADGNGVIVGGTVVANYTNGLLNGLGHTDAFIAALTSSGEPRWLRRFRFANWPARTANGTPTRDFVGDAHDAKLLRRPDGSLWFVIEHQADNAWKAYVMNADGTLR